MKNKNLRLFTQNSCSDTLTQNKEYMKLQPEYVLEQSCSDTKSQEEIQCEMEVETEKSYFMAGFKAAM